MARLYANENLPVQVVMELRHHGHDVLTTLESGRAGQAVSDEEVLAFATAEQRIVVTLNRRHFVRLHSEYPNHAGIIVCSFDQDYAGLAQRIDAAVASTASLSGVLVRVNRPD
jgi:hypothetical protein